MARRPRHKYLDPLDAIWLTVADRIGFRVDRSMEVYASTDGMGVMTIGDPSTLDPDDCLAQMILHELCHSLIEGVESLEVPDFGLDNLSERDVARRQRIFATTTTPFRKTRLRTTRTRRPQKRGSGRPDPNGPPGRLI